MSKLKMATWILGAVIAVVVLYMTAWRIYGAGVRAGAEAGIQGARDIGFTGHALQLRELLRASDDLDRADVSNAQRTLDMLVYQQYIRLEDDAAGGFLLVGTAQMRKEIERVRGMVRTHCGSPRPPRTEFDLCAEFAKRSNNAFQRTLEDSRR